MSTRRSAKASPVRACLIAYDTRRVKLAAKVIIAPGYKGWLALDAQSVKQRRFFNWNISGNTTFYCWID
jgi:hypothetical protein